MKLEHLTMGGYTSFLFKAPWGFGKTIAAASFAREGPIFLAYFDKKGPIELVQFFKKRAPELLKNIDYEVYSASNANEYLNKLILLSRDCRYVAVITDSVTNMTSAAVNWSLSFRDDRKNKDKMKVLPDFDEYKVETSLVTQALDICRTLPAHVIWTCHPLPSIKVEGSGATMRVTKVNSIVTYGSKVAGIVPGNFSEIYHFGKQADWNSAAGKSSTKYIVSTEQIGDDYAKSNIGLNVEMDITDKLFYDVWKAEVAKLEVKLDSIEAKSIVNPFAGLKDSNVVSINPDKKPWEK